MIDSHCHLDHEYLIDNIENILIRSKKVGIEKILTISTSLKSFSKVKSIVNQDDIIYGTFGIHPHETKSNYVNSDLIIKNLKQNKKIIGIGETGLDFYYNNSDKNSQINSFKEHIKASIKLNIPLIIHSRNAEEETFNVLNDYKKDNPKILMHCFTGSKKFAEKLLDLEAFFSASGIITFKNSSELRETFKFLPANKIMIETDSPYLAPEPNRGKKNEPSFIRYTANKLAILRGQEESELITQTTNNFNKLFFN